MKSHLPSMFAQADGGWFNFLHTMRGPYFLLLYFIWFIVTFGTVLLFRWRGKDTPLVTLGGLACYELLFHARDAEMGFPDSHDGDWRCHFSDSREF